MEHQASALLCPPELAGTRTNGELLHFAKDELLRLGNKNGGRKDNLRKERTLTSIGPAWWSDDPQLYIGVVCDALSLNPAALLGRDGTQAAA
jgi:hypothetical protein